MASLLPLSPCDGLLPRHVGAIGLSEVLIDPIFVIAPFTGKADAVSAALEAAVGLRLPAPGASGRAGDVRVLWAGQDLTLLMGAPPPDLAGLAAVTDQSDAWAIVAVEGAPVIDVLARLVPIDLREAAFAEGAVARTMLGHLTVGICRTGPQSFEIMAMRSMAATLVHDLCEAADSVAARAALQP